VTTPTTVQVRLQIRADTAANWTSVNPVLLANELGLESDTKKFKIGNGSSTWGSLAYFPSIVSGGTVLGNLEIGTTGTLTFEGSTADGFETTLGVVDPTADRTILLPNQSGTVVVGGNASITNADIAANAEIAVSKLADGAARQVLQTDAAGTGVEWTDNVDIPGTLDVTGAATFDSSVTITGDLTVNGTTTNINTQNLVVEDKNVILGDVATPTDVTADGGGITLKGTTDKTINWVDSTDAWTSSERFSVPLGSASAPSLTFTGDPNTGIYSPGADQVAISTGGSGRLFVDASGNVGVNTAPSARLHISDTDSSNAYTTGAILGTQTSIYKQIVHTNQSSGTNEAGIVLRAGTSGNIAEWGLSVQRTGATSGDLIFRTRTGASSSNEFVRITSGGLVGIGSSVPDERLSVAGAIRLTSNATSFTSSDGALIDWATDTMRLVAARNGANSSKINFVTYNAGVAVDAIRIDPTGRVGIGTTTAGRTLSVDSAIQISNSTSGFGLGNGLEILHETDGETYFLNRRNANMRFYTNNTERFRCDSSGRLLVGTSSGQGNSLLQVQGDASSAAAEGVLYLRRGLATAAIGSNVGADLGRIQFGANDGTVAASIRCISDGTWGSTSDTPGALTFSTTADGASSPTERMRITQDGDVFINHNSSNSPVVGGEKLGVLGGSEFAIAAQTTLNTKPTIYIANTSDTNNAYVARFSTGSGGNTRGEIYYNGSQLVYATSSDYRLKENVVSFDDGIEIVKQLRPVRYNWIENGNEDIGFIAHEVQAVFPNAVGGEKDAVDDNGKILPQTYDPSKLVPLLTAALQEAVAKIESLEARLTAAGI